MEWSKRKKFNPNGPGYPEAGHWYVLQSEAEERIAELEAKLATQANRCIEEANRAANAEAALERVRGLRDRWEKYGMEKHWIEWDNSTIFNKCADELAAALKEEGK